MLLGSYKYSIYKPHKLSQILPQILPTVSYISSNLGFPQKYLSHYYQIGPQNYTISTKKTQNHLPCGKNPKNQIKLSYKSYCYTAPLKARCYMALLKPRCYTAIFLQNLTKPKCYFDTYFIKLICYFGIYFTKSKYYFWQLIMKPNNTLAPIYKSPNIILAKTITLCSKA